MSRRALPMMRCYRKQRAWRRKPCGSIERDFGAYYPLGTRPKRAYDPAMRGFIPLLALGIGTLAGPPLAAQQAQPSIKPVASVPAAEPAPDVLTIGERTDRMTVPVTIGPHGPFPFIIDTGAERSVVSRELAGYLKLLPGTDVKLFDFTGAAQVATVKVPSLTAGKLGTPAMEAP